MLLAVLAALSLLQQPKREEGRIFEPGGRFAAGAAERDEEPGRVHRRMSIRGLGSARPVAPPPRPVTVADPAAPRVVELTLDDRGNVRVPAMQSGFRYRVSGVVQSTRTREEVEIGCIEGLRFYDTDGQAVARTDALKALAGGGTVIVAGRKADPAFLATVRKGTLMLVAPDLVLEPDYYGPWEIEP
jgi:hypothetical protein